MTSKNELSRSKKDDQSVLNGTKMITSRDIFPVILAEPRKTWFYINSFPNHWSHYNFIHDQNENSCVRISHWCENSKHFPFTSLFHWKLDHHQNLFLISLVFLSIIATLSSRGVTMNDWNGQLLLNLIEGSDDIYIHCLFYQIDLICLFVFWSQIMHKA